MTDPDALAERITRIERQLRATRALASAFLILVAAFVVGTACKHDAPAAPPTRIELRAADGVHAVTIDPNGIAIEEGTTVIRVSAEALVAETKGQHTRLSASALELDAKDGNTTLARDLLTIQHGKHKATIMASEESAQIVVGSDNLQRAVALTASPYFAVASTTFMPDDNVSTPHTGMLSADKTGSELSVATGKTKKSLSQP